jgi:NAD(P)-dependent dehydrogenase (short-subunit alcohol dehydrogenase family)
MFRLDQKIAFITGAASGIGAAIAQTFAEAGATVYIADRDLPGAQRQAEAVQRKGGKAQAVRLDVTSEAECLAVAQHVAAEAGPLHILVNNAGVGAVGTILQTSGADLDRLYQVNVRGIFNVTKAFLPAIVERKAGNVINLASIGGVVGIRDRLAYCTTKFAVVGLTKSLALDHAAQGIRANCICPARVETPFVSARLKEYPDPDAAYREMSSTQLFGRMIKPEEIAASALYLASDESHMITGTAFLIDCGWTAGK